MIALITCALLCIAIIGAYRMLRDVKIGDPWEGR